MACPFMSGAGPIPGGGSTVRHGPPRVSGARPERLRTKPQGRGAAAGVWQGLAVRVRQDVTSGRAAQPTGRCRAPGDLKRIRKRGRQNVLIVTTALLGPVCREPGIGYAGLSAIAPKVAGSFEVRLTTGSFAREGGTSHDRAR